MRWIQFTRIITHTHTHVLTFHQKHLARRCLQISSPFVPSSSKSIFFTALSVFLLSIFSSFFILVFFFRFFFFLFLFDLLWSCCDDLNWGFTDKLSISYMVPYQIPIPVLTFSIQYWKFARKPRFDLFNVFSFASIILFRFAFFSLPSCLHFNGAIVSLTTWEIRIKGNVYNVY